ncbi:MAG: hypothetical protein FGM54_05415 [Chitinophagaceae bacterium]|nr:hypothetical protein [Chitinophagaceae bacterium]
MKLNTLKPGLTLFFLLLFFSVFSQVPNRNKIKAAIREWGTCRNVAITAYGGDIALNYRNGCVFSGNVPSRLYSALVQLNKDGEYIDDIVLTEAGRYLVLYGSNGFIWNEIPYGLEKKMREYNNDKDVITSVSFNDNDDWIIIGERVSASSEKLINTIEQGMKKWGPLWTSHMTNDGLVLVYERGFQYFGNVPEQLIIKANNANFDVYRLKFASDGAFFISDKDGHFDYTM